MKLYYLLCLQTELPFQMQFQIKIDLLDYQFNINKLHGKEGKLQFFTFFYSQNDLLIDKLFLRLD